MAKLNNTVDATRKPPIEVNNEIVIHASAGEVWDVLTDVERWPSWWRACRWVRVESTPGSAAPRISFRWRAHPVVLRSTVVAADRPHSFAFVADTSGIHAERAFSIRPARDGRGTLVVSHETQVGWLAWLGRAILGPRLRAVNQAMFNDLARVIGHTSATTAIHAAE